MTWKAQKAFMALSRQLETTGLSRFELRRLGSIGNAIEIQIEEGYGNSEAVWVAQPRIKPKGISKKKRIIRVVEFRFYTEVKGRFTHLLPVMEGDEPPTILHCAFRRRRCNVSAVLTEFWLRKRMTSGGVAHRPT